MVKADHRECCLADAGNRPGRRVRMSVDLRGCHGALLAVARSQNVPVTSLLRTAILEWLEHASLIESGASMRVFESKQCTNARVKVTLRLPLDCALELASAAREACVPQGLYVAKLMASCPPRPVAPDQRESRAALIRSNAMLAALAADLRGLTATLRANCASVPASCDTSVAQLTETVVQHLALLAPMVTALQPSVRSGPLRQAVSANAARKEQGELNASTP